MCVRVVGGAQVLGQQWRQEREKKREIVFGQRSSVEEKTRGISFPVRAAGALRGTVSRDTTPLTERTYSDQATG
jgi:hypothetical protein